MKISKMYKIAAVLALALGLSQGVMAVTPQPGKGTVSAPISDQGITPYIIVGENQGGNRTCEEVGEAYFGNSSFYSWGVTSI